MLSLLLIATLASCWVLTGIERFLSDAIPLRGFLIVPIAGGALWLLGVHDWAALVPLAMAAGFAALTTLVVIDGVTLRQTVLDPRRRY